jgi:enoyl-CoA hydratase/carnithine racemase
MARVDFFMKDAGIGVVTLSDPGALNAMSPAMAADFSSLTTQLHQRDDLRVLVVTGKGRAFSAGGDLAMLREKTQQPEAQNRSEMLAFYQAFLGIRDLGVPLIAAINGAAVGAGLGLACACDWRLTVPHAKFAANFIHLGLHPGMGVSYTLPQIVGPARATDLLLSGRLFRGLEAEEMGLVQQVVEVDDFDACYMDCAQMLAQKAPTAVRALLQSLRGDPQQLSTVLEREAHCQALNFTEESCQAAIHQAWNSIVAKQQA